MMPQDSLTLPEMGGGAEEWGRSGAGPARAGEKPDAAGPEASPTAEGRGRTGTVVATLIRGCYADCYSPCSVPALLPLRRWRRLGCGPQCSSHGPPPCSCRHLQLPGRLLPGSCKVGSRLALFFGPTMSQDSVTLPEMGGGPKNGADLEPALQEPGRSRTQRDLKPAQQLKWCLVFFLSILFVCLLDEGEVFIWDVKSRRCLNRFTDEGCLRGTSIAVSKNGQYVACGSSSGVVNVYAQDDCLRKTTPKPLKAVMNLVTAATSLSFNPTSEILAIASQKIDDAVKLVHIPSLTVFSNFPWSGRKVIYLAESMDFSPRSGFFSIANNKGKALLYRLQHYSDF
uniref:Uncharacterized protein n=1 Tax=Sphaerodactylus townsendi TaxID=933632 RepID=A0ACB8EKQ4_9SAUR